MQSTVDAAEAKAVFDAQLSKANTDASQMKAAYDKVCACVCGGGGGVWRLRMSKWWSMNLGGK